MRRTILATAILASAITLPAQLQTVTVTSTRDNTLYFSSTGSLSNGAGTGMFAGVTATGEARRAVMAFDLSAVVPAGATVTAASVQLFVTMSGGSSGNMSLQRLVADWGESTSAATSGGGGAGAPAAAGDATWLHRSFPTVFWTNAGGDFAATASATLAVSTLGAQVWTSTPGLVADVQGWVNGPNTNFGWLVLTPETATDRARRFSTREEPIALQRPQLTVSFLPPPAATFSIFGAGCAGSAGTPSLAAAPASLPVLGSNFGLALGNLPAGTGACIGVLGLSNAVSGPGAGAYPLPASLAFAGMPGCTQYVSADATYLVVAASGQANWTLAIPLAGGLAGLNFYVQALVPDAAVNPLGATVTNAGSGVIGG